MVGRGGEVDRGAGRGGEGVGSGGVMHQPVLCIVHSVLALHVKVMATMSLLLVWIIREHGRENCKEDCKDDRWGRMTR